MPRSRAAVVAITVAVFVPAVALAGAGLVAGPRLSVLSPSAGTVVKKNVAPTRVAISGWRVDGMLAGKALVPGVGHYHMHLDGRLVNAYDAPRAALSLQNVTPGKHTLSFALARNDHSEVAGSRRTTTFRYVPSSPLPTVDPASFSGPPSIRIASPRNGATVSGMATLKISVESFNLSSSLFGKPQVAGYGHWHVFLDEAAMPRMMAMTAGKTLAVSLKGVKPGKHTLIAMLADNLHAPIPEAMAAVTINVR